MNSFTLRSHIVPVWKCSFISLFVRTSHLWLVFPRSILRRARSVSLCPPAMPCSPVSKTPTSGRWILTPESAGRTHWWAGPPREWTSFWLSCFLNRLMKSTVWSHFYSQSRADPLSNMVLAFSTKEEAIAFAEKNGNSSKHFSTIVTIFFKHDNLSIRIASKTVSWDRGCWALKKKCLCLWHKDSHLSSPCLLRPGVYTAHQQQWTYPKSSL